MTERGDLSFCIPIDVPKRGGGGFRFIANLRSYLERAGIPWTRRAGDGARVLLLNAWHVGWPTIVRAAWTRPDVTVVHRIDGAAQDYGRDPSADRAQSRADRLADVAIFQSEYCRYSTRVKFPVIGLDGPVIHNPVDTTLFRPDGPRADLPAWNGPRVCAVTWSTNPRKGSGAIYELARALPRLQFVLCGRFDAAPELPNVVLTGWLDPSALAATLRACDVLATFSENEACPNVVLEGLSSGLPVLFLDSGANRELVGECGLPVTRASFEAALDDVMDRRTDLSERARARACERFSPDLVFGRYLDVINAALRESSGRMQRMGELARRLVGVR